MACFAIRRTDSLHQHLGPNALPSGYGPADLQSAYGLGGGNAAGRVVAIVDAYDDPNAESDLGTYRSTYGLAACTTANGCFKKVNQNGVQGSYPAGNTGWAGEISLDVDMVSAACPTCHILLVEANSATTANLGTAVNTAVSLGAKYVSNSYGGGESSNESSYDASYYHHTGVAITASTGDDGYGVEYPAASPYVTAVGGTSLTRGGGSRGWTETAWSGAGSGCSAYEAKPAYQNVTTGCSRRAVADVSAVADPNTGVAVYQTYGGSGWAVYGGTSASSPIIASVYALAGVPGAGDTPASYPYAHPGNLWDVTSGSNGSCSPTQLCHAGTGWDGPTGLGTPNGTAAFAAGGTGWTGPTGLGMGPLASAPAVAIGTDGRRYVYWKGTDGSLKEAYWNGSSWTGPVSLGMGPLGSAPTAGIDSANRQYVYWQGTDNTLKEAYWNGSHWVGPVSLGMGPLASAPGATVGADGHQYVYWKGTDNTLKEAYWNGHRWAGPVSLGMGPLGSAPTAGIDSLNHQYVYWQGTDNTLKEARWNGHRWVGPTSLGMGPLASAPAADVTPDGQQYVYWGGSDGDLRQAHWDGTRWIGPTTLGMGPLGSAPTAAVDSQGDQYVYWEGTDGNLWQAYWLSS